MNLLLTLVLALGPVGCTKNLATGRSQLNLISTEREIALGSEASPAFLEQYGDEIPSKKISQYVSDIGYRLAAESERPQLPWEFHVVDSQVINAFALPGGKVFVSRGLLAKMDNEAQLAGVLGHEVGHVTAQHVGQRMTQAMIVQGVAAGLGVAAQASDEDWLRVLGAGAGMGGTVYLLKFGRDQELQSDWLGVRYMSRLGYSPIGQVQVLKILQKEAAGSHQPEFLSTHPLPQTRITQLEQHIRKNYPDYDQPGRYRFAAEEYKAKVLDELDKLPPPKHGVGPSAGLRRPFQRVKKPDRTTSRDDQAAVNTVSTRPLPSACTRVPCGGLASTFYKIVSPLPGIDSRDQRRG